MWLSIKLPILSQLSPLKPEWWHGRNFLHLQLQKHKMKSNTRGFYVICRPPLDFALLVWALTITPRFRETKSGFERTVTIIIAGEIDGRDRVKLPNVHSSLSCHPKKVPSHLISLLPGGIIPCPEPHPFLCDHVAHSFHGTHLGRIHIGEDQRWG